MTIYAPTDVLSITVPGGCGQPHEAGQLADGDRFAVTCAPCEPIIAAMRTGWAHSLDGVALTPDELGAVEAARKNAERQRDMTWASGPAGITDAIVTGLRTALNGATNTPSLLEEIAALTKEQRATLREMLADDASEPREAVDQNAAPTDATAPVRRGPGRPRKATAGNLSA